MPSQRGFTYLGLLLGVAVLSIGLTAASEVWVATARHQKLQQLEWVGEQYAKAIASYYETSTPGGRFYPRRLEDLLEDGRTLGVRRHLRKIYPNPLSGRPDWELVRSSDGGIRAVRPVSASGAIPLNLREFGYTPVAL